MSNLYCAKRLDKVSCPFCGMKVFGDCQDNVYIWKHDRRSGKDRRGPQLQVPNQHLAVGHTYPNHDRRKSTGRREDD